MINQQKFPKDFLWGASTASHQVEGGTHNQWSVWELANATNLAATAEERLNWLPDWQDVKSQATDPDNYVSGKGVDHYNRYEEDFDLLKKLQLNSFRFGIEWARINPEEGVWDKEAIAHYHRYVDAMKMRGITPVMNIWHWTMPTWFTDKGGFEKRENIVYFERFVQKVAEEYADKIDYIITINEPNVYTSFSYLTAEWPPQKAKPLLTFKVYRHLVQAHKQAYAILKQRRSTLQIGIAMQLGNIQAKRPHNVLDGIATKAMRYTWNWWFLNHVRHTQDFVGINYYLTDYYKGFSLQRAPNAEKLGNNVDVPVARRFNPSVPLSDVGWYMEPEGIYPLLIRAWDRYKKPIIITENGVADRNDDYRQWWIEETMVAMQRALSEGVDLRGYLHWSLLDNFEWKFGWWPKFGLIEVDRDNGMKRTVRPSAIWFARYLRGLQTGETPKPTPLPPSKVAEKVVAAEPTKPQPTTSQPSVAVAAPAPAAPAPVTPKAPTVFNRLRPTKQRRSGRGNIV